MLKGHFTTKWVYPYRKCWCKMPYECGVLSAAPFHSRWICVFGLAQIFVLFCFTQDTLTDTTLPFSWARDQLNKGTLTISSQSQTRDPNRKETRMASPTSLLSWAAMSASYYFWLVDETAHTKLNLFESLRPYFWKYTPDFLQCFECHLAWRSPPKRSL